MFQRTQFRNLLPLSQTVLAIFFGGWGLWLRDSLLSQPFFGSTLWNSTARFHVWPWPYKFAAILNMPAFVAGLLLSWPLDYLMPGLPEWMSALPTLLPVLLLWFWLGSWADKHVSRGKGWTILLLLVIACAGASSIPARVGGYTGYLLFGVVIWLIVGIAMIVKTTLRKPRQDSTGS